MNRRILQHREGLERGKAVRPPQLLTTDRQKGLFHRPRWEPLVQSEDSRPLGPKNLPHKNVFKA